ncbi:MAG: hypothetical protein HOJ35_11230 [Bdellovibrionales bacterium]|nr:hypothetical protein [Bdellovibrionales bacterium]
MSEIKGLDLNKIEIALVLQDLNEIKELTSLLKNMGITAHFYNDLVSFWNGIEQQKPNLSIVDVSLMSSGKLSLIDHPLVLSNELHLAFYFTDDTRPLLKSTVGINHLGVIQRQVCYESELKSLVFRLKESISRNIEFKELQSQSKALEEKLVKSRSNLEIAKEEKYYDSLLNKIMNQRNIYKEQIEFSEVLLKIVDELDIISEVSFVELNQTAQKLISPPIVHDKFKQLPALWLGRTSKMGIEFFAQNMATQVGLEVLGENLVSLSVKSEMENPEMVILLTVRDEEFLTRFNWERFEEFLSGIYVNIKLKRINTNIISKKVINPWDYLSALDTFFYRDGLQELGDYSVENSSIIIDFKLLISTVNNEVKNRFYWSKFFHDFSLQVEQLNVENIQLCTFGVDTISLIIPKEKQDYCIEKLRTITTSIKYWRYFENPDLVFNKSFKPRIRFAPLSSEGFISYMKNDRLFTSSKSDKVIQKDVSFLKVNKEQFSNI